MLTEEQQLMLKMSDVDIANGKVISQAELDKSDLEWLKGLPTTLLELIKK